MVMRVAPGQLRFGLPGLRADARGIATGPRLAVRLATLDRVVRFFRVLTAHESLDDLGSEPKTRLVRFATTGLREVLVTLPALAAESNDAIAAAARWAGGGVFTGDTKHVVRWRDAHAPQGHDVTTLDEGDADVVLYDREQTVHGRFEGELSFASLVARTPLRRLARAPARERDCLYACVAPGLGTWVLALLHRKGARGAVARGEPDTSEAASWLIRVDQPSAAIEASLARTPGVALFAAAGPSVAVALGFEHPFTLESCARAFGGDRFYLFEAPRGRSTAAVKVWSPAPRWAPIEAVIDLAVPALVDLPRDVHARDVAPLRVPLSLAPTVDDVPAVAVLVPWARVAWLGRLAYALPSQAVRGWKIARLDAGLLVIAPSTLEGLPFGDLFSLAAPGVLVPLGWHLVPAVSPDLVADRLGTKEGMWVLFTGTEHANIRIPTSAVRPFERSLLTDDAAAPKNETKTAATTALTIAPSADASSTAGAPELVFDGVGPMPLWGLPR